MVIGATAITSCRSRSTAGGAATIVVSAACPGASAQTLEDSCSP